MSKRPGEGGGPSDAKRAYGGPGQDFMDSEPMLPEEYEDPDDEDLFLSDVIDQKVRVMSTISRACESASDARVFESFPVAHPATPRLIHRARHRHAC